MIPLLLACVVSPVKDNGPVEAAPVDTAVLDSAEPPADTAAPDRPTLDPVQGTPCRLVDQDGDGWSRCDDCDDTDPTTYPGASAVCFDGQDNSCGVVKEEPCVLEGQILPRSVGAKTDVASVVDIQELWGSGAVLIGANAYRGDWHTGDLSWKQPALITDSAGDSTHRDVGDVTGDGLPDVGFRSALDGTYSHIRSNPDDPSSDIVIHAAWDFPPTGDVDGDGVRDLGIDKDNGVYWLFTDLAPGAVYEPEDALATLDFNYGDASEVYVQYGASEDIDGDGLVDAVVEHQFFWSFDGRGGVAVFLSPVVGERVRAVGGEHNDEFFDSYQHLWWLNARTPTMEDIDGDGRVELLVAASLEEYGARGLMVVPFLPTGEIDAPNVRLGWEDASIYALRSLEDLDGDGQNDLLVTHTGRDGGAAVSIYNLPGTTVDYWDDVASFSLAYEPVDYVFEPGIGDLDGDGTDEILFGGARATPGAQTYFTIYPGGL